MAGPISPTITVNGEEYSIAYVDDTVSLTWENGASANSDLYTISNDKVVWNDGTILQYNSVDVLPTDTIYASGEYTTRSAAATYSFRHLYSGGVIGSGSIKFKSYVATQIPQLATPQNVSIDGTTLSWDEVENATSYDIYADGTLLGTRRGAVTLINFTIDSTSYQAESGMTWEQWVESSYNTGGFTVHNYASNVNYPYPIKAPDSVGANLFVYTDGGKDVVQKGDVITDSNYILSGLGSSGGSAQ